MAFKDQKTFLVVYVCIREYYQAHIHANAQAEREYLR